MVTIMDSLYKKEECEHLKLPPGGGGAWGLGATNNENIPLYNIFYRRDIAEISLFFLNNLCWYTLHTGPLFDEIIAL